MRYWYHPESDSLFTTEDGEPEPANDGLLEEITEEEYHEIKQQQYKYLSNDL